MAKHRHRWKVNEQRGYRICTVCWAAQHKRLWVWWPLRPPPARKPD
jgi:hypothetical protein